MAGGFLVEIAQYADPEEDHGESEHDEPRTMAKKRPIAGEVGLEERELGKDEETWKILVLSTRRRRGDIPAMTILMTCSHASKKKNLETMKVLTSMTELAAMTERNAIMFMARMILSTT